eukprot:3792017-Rhodomonas_salina.2
MQNHGWFLGMALDDSLVAPALSQDLATLTLHPTEIEPLEQEPDPSAEDALDSANKPQKTAPRVNTSLAAGRALAVRSPIAGRRRLSEEVGAGGGGSPSAGGRRKSSEEAGIAAVVRSTSRERERGGVPSYARPTGEGRRKSTSSPERKPGGGASPENAVRSTRR